MLRRQLGAGCRRRAYWICVTIHTNLSTVRKRSHQQCGNGLEWSRAENNDLPRTQGGVNRSRCAPHLPPSLAVRSNTVETRTQPTRARTHLVSLPVQQLQQATSEPAWQSQRRTARTLTRSRPSTAADGHRLSPREPDSSLPQALPARQPGTGARTIIISSRSQLYCERTISVASNQQDSNPVFPTTYDMQYNPLIIHAKAIVPTSFIIIIVKACNV